MKAKLKVCVDCGPTGDNEVNALIGSLIDDIDSIQGHYGDPELIVQLGNELWDGLKINEAANPRGDKRLVFRRLELLQDTILSLRAHELTAAAVQLRCLNTFRNDIDDSDSSGERGDRFTRALYSILAVVDRLLNIPRHLFGGDYYLPLYADDAELEFRRFVRRDEPSVKEAVETACRTVAQTEAAGAARHAETLARAQPKSLAELVSEWRGLSAAAAELERKSQEAAQALESAGIPLYDKASRKHPDWKRWDAIAAEREKAGERMYDHERQIAPAPTRSTADLLAKLQFVRAQINTEGKHPDDWDYEAHALDEIIHSLMRGTLSATGSEHMEAPHVSAVAAE